MQKLNIREYRLAFTSLTDRYSTGKIIIHHTGSADDSDFSAEQIHQMHLNQGWSGIGYHYVVRKDGTIERGRPSKTIGAHCVGHNYDSIGIHVGGNFQIAEPTDAQIESTALLVAKLCEIYDLPITNQYIFGHRDFDATACPGNNLYLQLPLIIAKANFYANQDVEDSAEPVATNSDDVEKIAVLARRYESNGDPACVSSGVGDVGGISYGLYQLASNVGSVDNFVNWLIEYPDDKLANYGRVLAQYKVNNPLFISTWRDLGMVDPGNFGKLQDEFIKTQYYDVAYRKLQAENFNLDKHTDALKAVVFSRAVQNGPSGCVSLFKFAVVRLGYANLSYIDDKFFDKDLIGAIYGFLIDECDGAQKVGDIWKSANNFCKGSASVISGLRNRFSGERYDALNMLG